MIRPIFALMVFGISASATAQALTADEVRQCNAMAATFQTKQAEIMKLKEDQAALAAQAETLGEDWEVKEEQRLFSPAHGNAADEARTAFETARDAANFAAMDLNTKAAAFQADAAQFNEKCAAD